MKSYILIAISLLFIGYQSNAQCNYDKNSYSFDKETAVLYGVLPDYRGIMDSLYLDIYWPVGSPELEKPIIIWAFGGGFFQGKRQDFAPICEEMAQRGIISATIDYRIGFDGPGFGLNPPFAFDAAEIIRAGYRGATDMKGAIRYLKAHHKKYEIDLSRVWLGGASAGSIVALNAAFLNKESEKPKEAGAIGGVGAKERPDLGPIEGTLNVNGFNSEVQGVLNIFGALMDTSSIDPSDRIAVFSYHQSGDPVVPCQANRPYYPIPLISQNYPTAYGSCVITERLQNLQIPETHWETWIYTGTEHAVHNQDAVLNFMIEQAKPFLCKNILATKDQATSQILVFPNPAQSELHLLNLPGDCNYLIKNIAGQILQKGKVETTTPIYVEHYQSGIYFLELHFAESRVIKKWIKK